MVLVETLLDAPVYEELGVSEASLPPSVAQLQEQVLNRNRIIILMSFLLLSVTVSFLGITFIPATCNSIPQNASCPSDWLYFSVTKKCYKVSSLFSLHFAVLKQF